MIGALFFILPFGQMGLRWRNVALISSLYKKIDSSFACAILGLSIQE